MSPSQSKPYMLIVNDAVPDIAYNRLTTWHRLGAEGQLATVERVVNVMETCQQDLEDLQDETMFHAAARMLLDAELANAERREEELRAYNIVKEVGEVGGGMISTQTPSTAVEV